MRILKSLKKLTFSPEDKLASAKQRQASAEILARTVRDVVNKVNTPAKNA